MCFQRQIFTTSCALLGKEQLKAGLKMEDSKSNLGRGWKPYWAQVPHA